MKRNNKKNAAAALMMVVVVAGITTTLTMSYALVTLNTARQASNIQTSAKAYYAAEAGVEDALLRFYRDGFDTDGGQPYSLNSTLTTGDTSVTISKLSSYIKSNSNAAGRVRNIKLNLSGDSVFTFAAIVGGGGLDMGRKTKISCTYGAPCAGGAGDLGAVYVNGDILANGDNAGSEDNIDVGDSKIYGNVYTPGKVDIKPGEYNEQSDPSDPLSEGFVCLSSGVVSGCAIQAKSVVQKIVLHNGGKDARRAALRLAYKGILANIPQTDFYLVKYSTAGGNYVVKRTVPLESGFMSYAIDTDFDGNSDTIPEDEPHWVYFNFQPTGTGQMGTGNTVYLVLQVNGMLSNTNYWKVYYDKTAGYGNSLGGVYGSAVCISGVCTAGVTGATSGTNTLDSKDPTNAGEDFHFRLYNLGSDRSRYVNSLLVFGELHADEAIGATVHGETNRKIAFVGRRFVSPFYANFAGMHTLTGDSFVQQLDNCDISAASAADPTGADLNYAQPFRYFCDSNVRNVVAGTDLSGGTDRHTISSYNVYNFYDNPYDPSAPYDGNSNTPYNFHNLAQNPAPGPSWQIQVKRGCSVLGIYNTHYISDSDFFDACPSNQSSTCSYNFCRYYGGAGDTEETSETDFKTMLSDAPYSIPDSEQDNYLPKAPPGLKSGWPPISDESVGYLASDIELRAGTCNGISGTTYSITNSEQFEVPKCYSGNLEIANASTVTLKGGADLYVKGNIMVRSGSAIEMDGTPGEWGKYKYATVIADGYIRTDTTGKFLGGDPTNNQYMFVVARSLDAARMGDLDPGLGNDGAAAIYLTDNNNFVSFFAPGGSIVLSDNNTSAMQVMADRVVMREGSQINYGYGLIGLTSPGGPARGFGISAYVEE